MNSSTKKNAVVNGGKSSRPGRKRTEKRLVKVKVLNRTWWRGGSGTKLLNSEVVWENRVIEVPVAEGKEVRHG